MRRAGRRPDDLVRKQVTVEEGGNARGKADRWHAADSEAGMTSDRLGIRLSHGSSGQLGKAGQVEPIGSRDESQHRLIVTQEEQRLHDLANLGADRRGRLSRGASRVRELADLDRLSRCGEGRADSLYPAMNGRYG